MKKRLESELISIAHRILKLKNKSEVDQLYKETQKLYETLAVLKFYQDNFESVKSEVSSVVLEEKLEQSNQVESVSEPVKPDVLEVAEAEPEVTQPESTEQVQSEEEVEVTVDEESIVSEEHENTVEEELEEEPTLEEEEDQSDSELAEQIVSEDKPSFEPSFELEMDVVPTEMEQREEKLEDHIGKYADPVFVKPNEVSLFPSDTKEETKQEPIAETSKTEALHDGMSKSIAIGLNDRIGFVQHLFNDSNEDFNRVISQLNTFDTFEEAKNFINEMVIPDYNYWVGEEDYIERFMEIVEKKFR
ncbi:hypothetical protein [Flavobacterium sp.]|uniref:hypothetical protein n=1 Tax=Flavobacterium sp. TaxID=239 RepID=UPI0025FF712A|nr:hypothetical protein [Flavobacterium sp.]